MTQPENPPDPKRRISMERTFTASLEEVWGLWTTPEGIESWWGPEGFAVTVQALELRPGGNLRYTMTAVDPRMVAFMEQNGMPTSTVHTITYSEVSSPRRLGYVHPVDFVPGLPVYDTSTLVELFPAERGVRMVLTFDAMHDQMWTDRQTAGWTSELGKLDALLARRSA
ncbi:MAG: SRPBCC domain-containing protein [Pseudomonadota bacterium]|nr:SRPBCC domain-containing protein [Pseudomonadota bacterium]